MDVYKGVAPMARDKPKKFPGKDDIQDVSHETLVGISKRRASKGLKHKSLSQIRRDALRGYAHIKDKKVEE